MKVAASSKARVQEQDLSVVPKLEPKYPPTPARPAEAKDFSPSFGCPCMLKHPLRASLCKSMRLPFDLCTYIDCPHSHFDNPEEPSARSLPFSSTYISTVAFAWDKIEVRNSTTKSSSPTPACCPGYTKARQEEV